MVSKYIIGALLLGAASAKHHTLQKNGEEYFARPFHVNGNDVHVHKDHKDAEDKELKGFYCPKKQDLLCQFSHKIDTADKWHLICMASTINKEVYTEKDTFDFTTYEFKENVADAKEVDLEAMTCTKAATLEENEVKILTALVEKKYITEADKQKSEKDKNTLCMAATEKKVEEGKDKEYTIEYFLVETKEFKFEKFANESLKDLRHQIICGKDEDVTKAAKALNEDKKSGCSNWWWLLVIPVVGGIGAGAYYALKEEDDEVSEYDCEA